MIFVQFTTLHTIISKEIGSSKIGKRPEARTILSSNVNLSNSIDIFDSFWCNMCNILVVIVIIRELYYYYYYNTKYIQEGNKQTKEQSPHKDG